MQYKMGVSQSIRMFLEIKRSCIRQIHAFLFLYSPIEMKDVFYTQLME